LVAEKEETKDNDRQTELQGTHRQALAGRVVHMELTTWTVDLQLKNPQTDCWRNELRLLHRTHAPDMLYNHQ
jgi:hypothetical protein